MRRRRFLGSMAAVAGIGRPPARSRQAGYGPLGLAEVPNAAEAVVGDDGRTAYVAANSGFATVDLRDPTDPTVLAERRELLAERETGPMIGIDDIKVDGDRLVVPGPANPTRDVTVTGFLLFDVSDPAEPTSLAFHETSLPIHNAFIDEDRVYLTQGDAVDIVDVTDDDPEPVGSIDITDFEERWSDVHRFLRSPHDVWVQDRLAYLPTWEAGTWIVDVTDPASPTFEAHIEGRPFDEVASLSVDEARSAATEPPGNHHYAQPFADRRLLAIGKESWDARVGDGAGGPSGIELWDVSKPSEPIKLSEIHPPRAANETRQGTWTTSHNFEVVGDRLYSSWYHGGVKIHDISDPSNPRELAWWRQPDEAAFWSAVRATADVFVASSIGGNAAPDLTAGLYTFPTTIGEQAEPPSTPARATPPTSLATARPTPTPSPTDSPTPNRSEPPTRTGGQPGFGVVTGVAGLGTGLWWLRRHSRDR